MKGAMPSRSRPNPARRTAVARSDGPGRTKIRLDPDLQGPRPRNSGSQWIMKPRAWLSWLCWPSQGKALGGRGAVLTASLKPADIPEYTGFERG